MGLVVASGAARAQFFPGPSLIISNGRPEAIAIGDLNGDGKRDLLASAAAIDQVAIHYSLGQGQYSFPFAYFVDARLSAMAIADLDDNGENDIIGVDGDRGDLVLIYQFRNSPIPFRLSKLPGQDEPGFVVVAELSGDRFPEIIVSYQGADEIGLYRNIQGTIQFPERHPVGDGPRELALWNSSAGPRQILVEAGVLSRDVAIFDPDWNALQRLALGNPVALDLLDWNGTGPLDLLVIDAGGFARVYEGRDSGNFASVASWAIEPGATAVLAFEETSDPPGAVVLEPSYNRVSLYAKQGATATLESSYFLGASVERVLWEDTNNDGIKELIAPLPEEDRIAIIPRDGAGLRGYQTIITGGFPWRVLAQEAAAGLPPRVGVLCVIDDELWIYQLGSGVPQLSRILQAPEHSRSFRWADMNEDTIPDLLILGETGVLRFYAGAGSGFAAPVDFAIGITPQDLEPIHLEPTGPIDLAISDVGARRIYLLEGDGNGGLTLSDSLACDDPPRNLRAADLDLDGREDLVAVGDRENVCIFFNDISGVFLRVSHRVGDDPRGLTLGNFNGDVYPDIAVGVAGESSYTVFSSLAPRFYGLSVDGEFSPEGTQVLTRSDITGDGLDDLVMTSTATTGIAFHIASGAGRFSLPGRIRCSSYPTDICAVDANGDGREDLLVLDGLGSIMVFVPRSEEGTARAQPGPTTERGGRQRAVLPPIEILVEPDPTAPSFEFRLSNGLPDAGRLSIYDLRGRIVARPAIHRLGPGAYGARWLGVDENGVSVAAGRYYAEWRSGGRRAVQPLTRVRR
jgi:hypothetical protein